METISVGDTVEIRVVAQAATAIPKLVLGYAIKDRLGQTMYGTNTYYTKQALENVQAGQSFEFRIEFNANLGPGNYSVALALSGSESHISDNYEWRDLSIIFDVINIDKETFDGKIYIPSEIRIH